MQGIVAMIFAFIGFAIGIAIPPGDDWMKRVDHSVAMQVQAQEVVMRERASARTALAQAEAEFVARMTEVQLQKKRLVAQVDIRGQAIAAAREALAGLEARESEAFEIIAAEAKRVEAAKDE